MQLEGIKPEIQLGNMLLNAWVALSVSVYFNYGQNDLMSSDILKLNDSQDK